MGESEKSIGACLLRNPGSFKLGNKLASKLNTVGSACGWISFENFDPTMEQLVKIVKGINNGKKEFSGRLYIYNLFNLRNTKLNDATDEFEAFVDTAEYNITESLVSLNELKSHPWILLGWGIEKKKEEHSIN